MSESLNMVISKSKEIVREVIEKYDYEMFVGFSGGTDSMLCLHFMKELGIPFKAFHANTGIGVEKTREFVRDHCKNEAIELVEIRAKEDCGQDYEKMVLAHGFPGAAMHGRMYQKLKERPIRELHRRYKKKRGGKVIIFTGIRHDESRIRSGYANSIIDMVGGVIWVNPVYWFTKTQKQQWLETRSIPANPVSKMLGISGECLCGSFASRSEIDLVRIIEPETADYIENLERRVWEAGFHWRWHESPHKTLILEQKGQMPLIPRSQQFMCVGCTKNEGVN